MCFFRWDFVPLCELWHKMQTLARNGLKWKRPAYWSLWYTVFCFNPLNGNPTSDLSRVFLGRPIYTSNVERRRQGWRQADKCLKIVPPHTLKVHSLPVSVLRFLCKTFSKLRKLTLRKICFCGWFLKTLYIQIKNLYAYKLVRAGKRNKVKRCSK